MDVLFQAQVVEEVLQLWASRIVQVRQKTMKKLAVAHAGAASRLQLSKLTSTIPSSPSAYGYGWGGGVS